MNINEYESQVDTAMENCDYGSDDIILGDINHDTDVVSDTDATAIMEAVLESLCDMDDETLVETISALDDDSVCAIYAAAAEAIDANDMEAATEAGGGGGSGGKPPQPPKVPKAPTMKKLTSADVIAQGRSSGGLLGNIKDSLLAGGRNKLDAATIDVIHDLGVKSGSNSYKRSQLMTSKASEQDKLRVGSGLDIASKNNRDQVLALVKSKTKDPRAIAAAMDLYNKSSSAQVSNHQAHKMSMDSWKEGHKTELDDYKKKLEANKKKSEGLAAKRERDKEIQKKYPELWKKMQQQESRNKEDKALDRFAQVEGGKYKDTIDKIKDQTHRDRNEADSKASESEFLKNLAAVNPKAADRIRKRNELTRGIEKGKRDARAEQIREDRKENIKSFVNNEMPTFVQGAKKAKAGATHAKNRLDTKTKAAAQAYANGGGLKGAIKDFITASTGEETGLLSDIDVGLVMENISENGFGACAFALEKAYRAIESMTSLSDEEFDDCMNAMSCVEAIELTENINFICDILDDYEEYASCVEAAIKDIDYATEDTTPTPDSQDQNQKPTIGQRIKNFFTGNGSTSGFKDRVKSAAGGLKDRISKWWNGSNQNQNDQNQNGNGQDQNKPQNQPNNNGQNNNQNQNQNGQNPNNPKDQKQLTPKQTEKQRRKELALKAANSQAIKEHNATLGQVQADRVKAGSQAVDKDAQAKLKEELMQKHAAKLAQKNLDEKHGGDAAKFGKAVSQDDINAAKKQISNNAYVHQAERDADSRRHQIQVNVNKAKDVVNNAATNIKEGAGKAVKVVKKAFTTPIQLRPATASADGEFDRDTYDALLEAFTFIADTRDIYVAFESMSVDEVNAAFESMSVDEAMMIKDIFEVNELIEAFEDAYEMLADENATMEDVAATFTEIYDNNYGTAFECYMSCMIADIDDDSTENVLYDALESMSMDEFAELLDSCSYGELLAIESVYNSEDDITLSDIANELLSLDSDAMESVVASLDSTTFDIVMNALTEVISQ